MDYRAPDFGDQFHLSRTPWAPLEGFVAFTQAGWTLHAGSRLPVTVLTHRGREVGWLLGWAVLPEGGFADETGSVDIPSPTDVSAVEGFLDGLAGRWLCVLTTGGARAYLDAGGTLAAVYSPRREEFASTTTLLQENPTARPTRRAVPPNRFYPFGETSDPTMFRLLPSHTLDLGTFETSRYWPRAPIVRVTDDAGVAEQVAIIATRLERIMGELARRVRLLLPLTAGRDSRMFVAAARTVLDRSHFVTFDYGDQRRADVDYARDVARDFDLPLTVVPLPRRASASARSDYLHAIGNDNADGKARDFLMGASALPEHRGWLTGFAGEVGRGYFWGDLDEAITPELLLNRMSLDATPVRLELATRWLESLPDGDAAFVLDMMYIDVRLGGWPSPQQYGTAPFTLVAMPIAQREIFAAMLRLPVAFRREQKLSPAVVRMLWPELAEYPYQRRKGAIGYWDRVRAIPFKLRMHLGYLLNRMRGRTF